MSILSEVKCARCDRKYSGVRSRCPYCGARRIGSGKYSEEGDNSRGKMMIGVLIMSVLVVAAGILLFSAKPETPSDSLGGSYQSEDDPNGGGLPDDGDVNQLINDDDDEIEDNITEEDDDNNIEIPPIPVEIESITITYAGAPINDFSEPISKQTPLVAKIEPAGVEFDEEIIWESSNPQVFEVVTTNLEKTNATVTIIGTARDVNGNYIQNAILTVRVGMIEATCTVRVSR